MSARRRWVRRALDLVTVACIVAMLFVTASLISKNQSDGTRPTAPPQHTREEGPTVEV